MNMHKTLFWGRQNCGKFSEISPKYLYWEAARLGGRKWLTVQHSCCSRCMCRHSKPSEAVRWSSSALSLRSTRALQVYSRPSFPACWAEHTACPKKALLQGRESSQTEPCLKMHLGREIKGPSRGEVKGAKRQRHSNPKAWLCSCCGTAWKASLPSGSVPAI